MSREKHFTRYANGSLDEAVCSRVVRYKSCSCWYMELREGVGGFGVVFFESIVSKPSDGVSC